MLKKFKDFIFNIFAIKYVEENADTIIKRCIALLIFCVFIIIFELFFVSFVGGDLESYGQFGDYLGGTLNPLFSVFNLFFVLYIMIMQNSDRKKSDALREQEKKSQERLELLNFYSSKIKFKETLLLAKQKEIDMMFVGAQSYSIYLSIKKQERDILESLENDKNKILEDIKELIERAEKIVPGATALTPAETPPGAAPPSPQ